eukprot:JP438187.1.p1 GENE.JP438187.1~~JP438187.1.p1  ORF type:complete len:120 (+),score=26.73 JP438187.1:24-362(+)
MESWTFDTAFEKVCEPMEWTKREECEQRLVNLKLAAGAQLHSLLPEWVRNYHTECPTFMAATTGPVFGITEDPAAMLDFDEVTFDIILGTKTPTPPPTYGSSTRAGPEMFDP